MRTHWKPLVLFLGFCTLGSAVLLYALIWLALTILTACLQLEP